LVIPAARATARTTWPTRWRVRVCGTGPAPCWRLANSGPAGADVQPEQLGQLAADRHLAPLAALAPANDHDALGKADVLDPQLDQFGSPQAGFEQGLQHQPGSAVAGISLIEKAQLFLHRETVHAAAVRGWRPQPGLLPGGFEDRLALGVIQALADEDSGDCSGGTREGSHDPVCSIPFGVQTDHVRRFGEAEIDEGCPCRARSGFLLRRLWKAHSSVLHRRASCASGSCFRSATMTALPALPALSRR
jgi:hypothetical protein